MRMILIASLLLLPLSGVAAAATHHPVTGKKLHNAMPAAATHHPVTGKKLRNVVKPGKAAKAKAAKPKS